MTLDDLIKLSKEMSSLSDSRPQWLRDLPSGLPEEQERYYRFFYEMGKRWPVDKILEIGTFRGRSIAHLAMGNPGGLHTTIDINPESAKIVESFNIPNIITMTEDSFVAIGDFKECDPFDILFLDGEHDYKHTHTEYILYRSLLKKGGIIFFDDIHQSPEMEKVWADIKDPKVELPELHVSGFGACQI